MTELTFIPPTNRRGMTRARAARIFLARNGKCAICGEQIRGEAYEVEHPQALALGGSDDDDALTVVHVRCHKGKTRQDRAAIAKRDRIVSQGWVGNRKPSRLRKPKGRKYSWALGRYIHPEAAE